MCGIIGAIDNRVLTQPVMKYLKDGLIVDAVRGRHSTGVVTLSSKLVNQRTKKFYHIEKAAVNGTTFIDEHYDPVLDRDPVYALIGHNRYATIGGITDATAHPFKVGNVIGVHNGTLTGDWTTKLAAPKSMEVDSNALMHSLHHRGYKTTFEQVTGAIATVWCDILTDRTFVYRNRQRPLHYAKLSNGALVYGSEKMMVAWLCDRNHLTIKGEIESFDVETVYEITGGEVKILEEISTPFDYEDDYGYGNYATSYGAATATSSYRPGYRGRAPAATTAVVGEVVEDDLHKTTRFRVPCYNASGLAKVYGGDAAPSSAEMYGGGMTGAVERTVLPIRVPFYLSDELLRTAGYKVQKGVFFRGKKITDFEKRRGIVGEYAEVVSAEPKISIVSGISLQDEYLEGKDEHGLFVIGCDELAEYRDICEDDETQFIRIIRRNAVTEFKVEKTA